MDGGTLRGGAVGCVKNFKNPVKLARAVMERSPHVLLVGEGAELFADSLRDEKLIKISNDELKTEKACKALERNPTYQQLLQTKMPSDDENTSHGATVGTDDPPRAIASSAPDRSAMEIIKTKSSPPDVASSDESLHQAKRKRRRTEEQDISDTVGAIAIDACGNLAVAISTGGLTAKLPGRVGDSPLVGEQCSDFGPQNDR